MISTAGWETISKPRQGLRRIPNMLDYERTRTEFSWAGARAELDGLPGGGGLNVAHEAVDRHVRAGLGERCAIRWLRRDGGVEELSFGELQERSNQFANGLAALGVRRG